MPSLREEITKTFLRLSRRGDSSLPRPEIDDTIARPDPREGQQLAAYRILKRLGAGGMGHVYLALDTRLGRHVALKFLSPDLVADPAMLHHLEQEARTASALNHPNILTIYEIGELGQDHFIASEFVDGATLRSTMERSLMDPGTAVDIATQIVSALTAAHAAGIVHRDLKPGNVIVRPDGLVKVIDFGLAKRTVKTGQEADLSAGDEDSVVGTVDYMSPEQARGDEVDHRSDLWSVGVLLYEMVAHKRPFEGETEAQVVAAILNRPVPALPLDKGVTAPLAKIVQRALAKDPAKRYQAATEMLADLHSISHVSRPGSGIRSDQFPRGSGSRNKVYVLALVAVVAAGLALLISRETRGPDWFQVASVRPLTFNGRTKLASISPDGKFLAFVVTQPDTSEAMYLEDVKTGAEEIRLKPQKTTYKGVTFSPEGQTIFVSAKDEKLMGRLYSVPLVGNASETLVLEDIDGPVSFSPFGDQFAFVRYIPSGTESRLEIGRPDRSERTLTATRRALLSQWVAWSPNGNRIATFSRAGAEKLLQLVDLNGRSSTRSLPGWRSTEQPCWTPVGKTLIVPVATYSQDTGQAQLKEIAVDTGEIRDVNPDLAGYASPSLTRDGSLLVAIKLESRARLWVSAPGTVRAGEIVSAEAGDYRSLSWSDPNHLIISSRRGGGLNLSSFDLLTQTRINLTNDPYVEQGTTSVPNSRAIVFASTRSGGSHIWKFDPDSNTYTQLTFAATYDESPTLSPDGKWIVYTSWTGNAAHLRKIAIDGGVGAQIGSYIATNPQISPDGRWVACQLQDPKTLQLNVAVIPFDGEGPLREFPNARLPFRWYADTKALASVLADARGVSNIWSIPLDGTAPKQLTDFADEAIFAFAWSPDGNRLACIRGTLSSDAVVFQRRKSR